MTLFVPTVLEFSDDFSNIYIHIETDLSCELWLSYTDHYPARVPVRRMRRGVSLLCGWYFQWGLTTTVPQDTPGPSTIHEYTVAKPNPDTNLWGHFHEGLVITPKQADTVPIQIWQAGPPLFELIDTFTRPDNIDNTLTDLGNTESPSVPWLSFGNGGHGQRMGIQMFAAICFATDETNAHPLTAPPGQKFAIPDIDLPSPDMSAQCQIRSHPIQDVGIPPRSGPPSLLSDTGPIIRVQDSFHAFNLCSQGGLIKLQRFDPAIPPFGIVDLATIPYFPSDGDTLRISALGDEIRGEVWNSGTLVVDLRATDAHYNTALRCGLGLPGRPSAAAAYFSAGSPPRNDAPNPPLGPFD